ncbi:MAG: hypothetical protein R3B55_02100 [Candidatus Paceibacterota bacterium]
MNIKFLKFILSFTFVLGGLFLINTENAEAACVVNSAQFRTVNAQGATTAIPPDGWYFDTNPPYVYIDFQTTGCTGVNDTFELSITEYDVGEDITDDGGSNMFEGLGAPGSSDDDDITGFDNRTINPSVPNFTLVFRAGDDECESTGDPDCRYYIRINDDVLNNVSSYSLTSNINYNCNNGCDNKNWSYVVEIAFGDVHSGDTELQNENNSNNNSTGTSTGIAGEDIEINIQNPIGPSDMTLIDFIQKVLNFALTIGIPIIAIAIIYSGLLFVTARGNDKQLETAKNAFTYAIIGGAVLLGSWIFAKLIQDTIESIVMISSYFG